MPLNIHSITMFFALLYSPTPHCFELQLVVYICKVLRKVPVNTIKILVVLFTLLLIRGFRSFLVIALWWSITALTTLCLFSNWRTLKLFPNFYNHNQYILLHIIFRPLKMTIKVIFLRVSIFLEEVLVDCKSTFKFSDCYQPAGYCEDTKIVSFLQILPNHRYF